MKKISFIIIIIVISVVLVGCGGFGETKRYTVNVPSLDLIRRLDSLKTKHPEYNVFSTKPDGSVINLDVSTDPVRRRLYKNYYFKLLANNNIVIVHITVRVRYTEEMGTVWLIGFADEDRRHWHDIQSSEVTGEQQKYIENLFKTRILDAINVKIKFKLFDFIDNTFYYRKIFY